MFSTYFLLFYFLFFYFLLDGTVTRGCISDLTDEQHTNCDKQEKCILCTGDNCNKHDNSSSVKKSANLFMCSVAILLAFILQNH